MLEGGGSILTPQSNQIRLQVVCGLLLLCLLVVLQSSTFWQWMFPLSYTVEVTEVAHHYEMDPLLILAIIQNESAFQQESSSRKGARGLMQIMPDTAEWVNEISGLNQEPDEYIDDAQANLHLGSWYLSYLLNKYDENSIKAVAAYNAGEGNVDRWLREEIWDGTWRNVEQIPFGETRHYVIRIQFYYQQYQSIYTDQLS